MTACWILHICGNDFERCLQFLLCTYVLKTRNVSRMHSSPYTYIIVDTSVILKLLDVVHKLLVL